MRQTLLLLAAAMALPASLWAVTGPELRAQIDTILNRTAVQGNTWSVLIESQTGSSIYFDRTPDRLLKPASNTKLYTSSAAYELLGYNHVWPYTGTSILSSLYPINKNSNNEDADELLRYLGQQRRGSATFTAGSAEVLAWCSSRGIDMTGALMFDGSGLSHNNRFSARQTLHLIRYMLDNYTAWDDTLSIGCVDGTIGGRFCGTAASGRVHAKTGTLTGVRALSGYIQNPTDGKIYLFSFLVNNVSDEAATLDAMDDAVVVMAQSGIPELGNGLPAIIVDNTDPGYTETGTWTTSTSVGFYGTDSRFATTGAGAASAAWTGTMPQTGLYEVFGWWVAGGNRANNAPYTVEHDLGSSLVSANQTTNGGAWNSLGEYILSAGPTTVRLSNSAESSKVVIADAVQFLYRGEAEFIVDNDDGAPGFQTSGTWAPSTGNGFRGTTSLFSNVGGGGIATWQPTLPRDGEYEAFGWWVASSNRVTNASYRINHAEGAALRSVNQTTLGGQWNSLGTYQFRAAGARSVTLESSGSGSVVSADSVRFVYRGPGTLSDAGGWMMR